MTNEQLEKIRTINCSKVLQICDKKNINGLCDYMNIYLPSSANDIFKKFQEIPQYGTIKNHEIFNQETIIDNNNTFWSYVEHLVISGATVEDYYEDLLLHEAVHLCGSAGGHAIKEGMTELASRKIAKKYGLKTNGCAYSKELKIVLELEKIFGEKIINTITFIDSMEDIRNYLIKTIGIEASELFDNISNCMQQEYYLKYAKYSDTFQGMEGIKKKCDYYSQVDYSKVYELLALYQNNQSK